MLAGWTNSLSRSRSLVPIEAFRYRIGNPSVTAHHDVAESLWKLSCHRQIHRRANSIITSGFFPTMVGALGGGIAFGIFFLFMVGQLLWVLKVMPETKGIPLEEMSAKLGIEDN